MRTPGKSACFGAQGAGNKSLVFVESRAEAERTAAAMSGPGARWLGMFRRSRVTGSGSKGSTLL